MEHAGGTMGGRSPWQGRVVVSCWERKYSVALWSSCSPPPEPEADFVGDVSVDRCLQAPPLLQLVSDSRTTRGGDVGVRVPKFGGERNARGKSLQRATPPRPRESVFRGGACSRRIYSVTPGRPQLWVRYFHGFVPSHLSLVIFGSAGFF